jgi:hypothetical protein
MNRNKFLHLLQKLYGIIGYPLIQKWNLKGGYQVFIKLFFIGEWPRSRRYGRAAAMTLIVQPYDEDEDEDDEWN